MKHISAEDLFPMHVTPMNFSRGDVVKKIYMDNINTPYVGVVTAIIPSTNKVEVQWPYGNGIEEPWDLIKVNPIINPPTVRQDKSYKTYQNQNAQKYNEDYCSKLNHYNILNDYMSEYYMPMMRAACELYNEGIDHKQAFLALKKTFENKEALNNIIKGVFFDTANIKLSNLITVNEEPKEVSVMLEGDSYNGFKLSYSLGSQKKEEYFNSYKKAFDNFKKYENIILNLDSKIDVDQIVKKASKNKNISIDELVDAKVIGSTLAHVENVKVAELDIDSLVDDIYKSLR